MTYQRFQQTTVSANCVIRRRCSGELARGKITCNHFSMKGTCCLRTSASFSALFRSLSLFLPSFPAFLVSSRFVSCAVYRWDRRWRNLPSDRHAVNEHMDRSRFPHSSCMACQIAITAAAAIDIARGPTRGSCLPGGEK